MRKKVIFYVPVVVLAGGLLTISQFACYGLEYLMLATFGGIFVQNFEMLSFGKI